MSVLKYRKPDGTFEKVDVAVAFRGMEHLEVISSNRDVKTVELKFAPNYIFLLANGINGQAYIYAVMYDRLNNFNFDDGIDRSSIKLIDFYSGTHNETTVPVFEVNGNILSFSTGGWLYEHSAGSRTVEIYYA